MNIQPPAAAASIAGTARAAAKGGEGDNQASEGARRLAVTEQPAGKASETPGIDAGEQTGDRGGDGREMYDRFESSRKQEGAEEDSLPDPSPQAAPDSFPAGDQSHIDFQA